MNTKRKNFGVIALLLTGAMLFSCASCAPSSSANQPNVPDYTQPENPNNPNDPSQPDNPNNPDNPSDPTDPVTPSEPKPYEDESMYYWLPEITEQMPVIRINTADKSNDFATKYNRDNKTRGEIDYVSGTVSVENCDEEFKLTDIETQVKVRGNFTLNYEKKPLRLKLDKKNNLLGLHGGEKFKNWVLLADVKDLSMCNNTTAFYLGKTILGSNGYYSSDYRNVEVYLNNEYWGVYLLVEQQEVKEGKSSNRMSVPEVEDDYTETDIGYVVEYDSYYVDERAMPDGDPTFEVHYDGNAQYVQHGYTVKSDINDQKQVAFIQRYLTNVYAIANRAVKGNYYEFSENGGITKIKDTQDLTAKSVVSEVIDVQSLVDMYILNEIVCNPDVDWSSFYISVDMSEEGNKKLVFEAPWDFDSALGIRPAGPYGTSCDNAKQMYVGTAKNPWLNLFLETDWFKELVKEKWSKLQKASVPKTALDLIIKQRDVYANYYVKNNQRWPAARNAALGELNGTAQAFKNQADAANYLHSWLEQRFTFLDAQWK